MPRVAPTLYEFVEADNGDYLKVSEAVFRIFDRQDWLRVNRARARIKVFVDKFGIDELRNQVEEELQGDWVDERDFDVEHRLFLDDEEANAPSVPAGYGSPNGDLSEFERFCASNVEAQKQDGFSAVQVHVRRGDLSPDQMRGLAEILREHSGGYARTTVHQNLLLRWVRNESVYDVFKALGELGLDAAGADEIFDVVSCPGTDSCKLGITSSMGLNAAIRERLAKMEIGDPAAAAHPHQDERLPERVQPAPHRQHRFYGASIKVGEHTIPAYVAHIGGTYEGGEIAYGDRLKVRLAAKRVPDAVERWLRMYQAERADGEEFNAYAHRVGTIRFEDEVRELTLPIEFGLETMNQFMDWSKNAPFKVERGRGRVRGLA